MKKIGLIGGMSWESSLEYYRIINETVKQYKAVVNKPVKWIKKVKLSDITSNITVNIPEDSGNISVKKIEKGIRKDLKKVSIKVDDEIAELKTYNLLTEVYKKNKTKDKKDNHSRKQKFKYNTYCCN